MTWSGGEGGGVSYFKRKHAESWGVIITCSEAFWAICEDAVDKRKGVHERRSRTVRRPNLQAADELSAQIGQVVLWSGLKKTQNELGHAPLSFLFWVLALNLEHLREQQSGSVAVQLSDVLLFTTRGQCFPEHCRTQHLQLFWRGGEQRHQVLLEL